MYKCVFVREESVCVPYLLHICEVKLSVHA